jgi:DNA polymerase III subunit epsilon
MNLQLQKPLACVDLESTGLNISKDRIVEIAIVKVNPDGTRDQKVMRINPTIPISEESTEIHGISDADVANEPTFKDVANEIKMFLDDCDLCGYNSNRFDFAMLTEEFLRAGVDIDLKDRNLIDAQQIFMKQEPRTLTAALKFYCDKDMENAHEALADVEATLDILFAQVERYDIGNTAEELHKISKGDDNLDYARRIKLNGKGIPVFNFGKFKDQAVADIFKKEPQYYDWIMRSDFAQDTKNVLSKLFNQTMLNKS